MGIAGSYVINRAWRDSLPTAGGRTLSGGPISKVSLALLSAMVAVAAAEAGLRIMDGADLYYYADRHPTAEGHRVVAAALLPRLRKLLDEATGE